MPDRRAGPRVLLPLAVSTFGAPEVVAWCCRLATGERRADDPPLDWLGGTDGWPPYWCRVWGLRGLLYVWDPVAVDAVEAGLGDEHWRAREMAAKVVRAHRVEALAEPVVRLLDDDRERVRAAAHRALVALGLP